MYGRAAQVVQVDVSSQTWRIIARIYVVMRRALLVRVEKVQVIEKEYIWCPRGLRWTKQVLFLCERQSLLSDLMGKLTWVVRLLNLEETCGLCVWVLRYIVVDCAVGSSALSERLSSPVSKAPSHVQMSLQSLVCDPRQALGRKERSPMMRHGSVVRPTMFLASLDIKTAFNEARPRPRP